MTVNKTEIKFYTPFNMRYAMSSVETMKPKKCDQCYTRKGLEEIR